MCVCEREREREADRQKVKWVGRDDKKSAKNRWEYKTNILILSQGRKIKMVLDWDFVSYVFELLEENE